VEVPALRGVNFKVQPGEFVRSWAIRLWQVVLLYVIGGLAQSSRGRVLVDGNDLAAMNDAERTKLRRHKIGFVFQRFNLLPTLDARGTSPSRSISMGTASTRTGSRWSPRCSGLPTACRTGRGSFPEVNSSAWPSRGHYQ